MSWLTLFLAVGAVTRMTNFVTREDGPGDIAAKFRMWVGRRWGGASWQYTLIDCPRCTSVWLSPLAAVPAVLWPHHPGFLIPAVILTLSQVASMVITARE